MKYSQRTPSTNGHHQEQRGSATVELALSLPLLVMLLLLMIQVSVVLLDQLAVTQAAREAARAVAVDPSPGAAAAAAASATGLDRNKLRVEVGSRQEGRVVEVVVRYTSTVRFPLTSRVLLRPVVAAEASMRVEGGA